MAVSICTVWLILSIFSLFISIRSVCSTENTTSDAVKSTVPVEQNSKYTFTDIYTSTEPTTTQSFYRPTEQRPAAAEPLPVSGSIHSPVAGGSQLENMISVTIF
ncbi:hypothetical protein GOODEAATRI_025760 [Goodea atripinnis]|uniref:Uncharacterized protein n=1 Tax=Goodea atripinnis TaxID=208336 RepID=A0ABV0MVB2_9TELE